MPDTSKVFVIDTSVLLYDARSIRSFGSKDVVLPYVVLEELDKFKSRDGEIGKNARQVARELNKLRQTGPIDKGVVVTSKGGQLRVELNFNTLESPHLNAKINDDRILNVCLGLAKKVSEVILVTKDINLAVRADVLGIQAQDFDSEGLVKSADDIYTGSSILTVSNELIEEFYAGKEVFGTDLTEKVYPNQYLTLISITDPGKTALARVVSNNKPLVKVKSKNSIWGIQARNREQLFAADSLLNPEINLVTLTGYAGTGKTVVSLACALELVQEKKLYDRLIVSRPVQPLGRDIGYLPGNVQEKMNPWMSPIRDSIEFLMRGRSRENDIYDGMVEMGMLEVEPLTYIRGRSIPNTMFLIDEAQNLTKPEIKTIVSRIGENSKLVLIGDISQIDNPYLDPTNNGLSNVVEKFKFYDIAAHIRLSKGERSKLATVAANIL